VIVCAAKCLNRDNFTLLSIHGIPNNTYSKRYIFERSAFTVSEGKYDAINYAAIYVSRKISLPSRFNAYRCLRNSLRTKLHRAEEPSYRIILKSSLTVVSKSRRIFRHVSQILSDSINRIHNITRSRTVEPRLNSLRYYIFYNIIHHRIFRSR